MPAYDKGVYRNPIATLKSHHESVELISTGHDKTPRNAIAIKTAVSRNCDQRFERVERSQKCLSPNFALKKKNARTS